MENNFESIDLNPKKTSRKTVIVSIVSLVLVCVLAITTALLLKYYVFTSFIVDGISMYPTLDGGGGANTDLSQTNGEVLYLDKVAKIKRGDIIVFTTPDSWGKFVIDEDGNKVNKSLVKRVIAIGGDHIQIINNIVYLNGEKLEEDYIYKGTMNTADLDIQIEEGNIFCMGDNRNNSDDCRAFGQIPLDCVIGKCFLIKGLDGKLRIANK